MTGEIIQIGHWEKPTSAPTEYRWSCDLQVWNTDTGVIGLVAGSETRDGEELGDRLRRIADELDQLAFFLTQQAEETLPSRDGVCLAKVAIFESSRVQIQVHKEKIPSERQEEWLRERLDHAEGLVGS
jgi:hypothetical protein